MQLYLLTVKGEDCYGTASEDIILAGIDCKDIFEDILEMLTEKLEVLEGEEIIRIIDGKYELSEAAREYLLQLFPTEDEYGEPYALISVNNIYIQEFPLGIFSKADIQDDFQNIIPAAKVVNKKEEFYITEGDKILLSDKQGRVCGGVFEGMDIYHEDKKADETYHIVLMGVLDEIVEIDSREIKSMQKLKAEII